jgi:isopenicillin N synthase-like dioxygenase
MHSKAREMNIPTIDIALFSTGMSAQRAVITAQVDAAATQIGFTQIVEHVIPTTVIYALKQGMEDFLAYPWSRKCRGVRPRSKSTAATTAQFQSI